MSVLKVIFYFFFAKHCVKTDPLGNSVLQPDAKVLDLLEEIDIIVLDAHHFV